MTLKFTIQKLEQVKFKIIFHSDLFCMNIYLIYLIECCLFIYLYLGKITTILSTVLYLLFSLLLYREYFYVIKISCNSHFY